MISIVTVNYNGEKFLNFFLKSLVNQEFSEFILYFVDNCSTDNSLNILGDYSSSLNIKTIKLDKNYGFAKANNIAIDIAMKDESNFVMTLNNDIELDKNCLKIINEQITDNNKYDIFQVLMINYYNRNIIDAAGIGFKKYYCSYQIGYKDDVKNIGKYNCEIDGACAGAAVYSKQSLKAVKQLNGDYFDSGFFAYLEDVDLALRLLNKGYKSLLLKDSFVYHIHSGTSSEGSTFKAYYITRNLFLYLNKNLTKKQLIKYGAFHYAVFIKKQIGYFISGKFKLIKASFEGYLDYKNVLKNGKM